MHESHSLDAAFEACCASGGGGAEVETLRTQAEPLLISRLTIVSTDPQVIRESIGQAFAMFSQGVFEWPSLNWRAWLVAAAFACLADRLNHTGWLDRHVPSSFLGSSIERHAALIGVILTLEGRCQWRLLKCVSGRWLDEFRAKSCVNELKERLRALNTQV